MPYYLRHITAAVFLLASSTAVAAQSFEAVGTRAAGMGGAFVAIADDATSAYSNPAGLTLLFRPEVSAEGRFWRLTSRVLDRGHGFGEATGIGVDTIDGFVDKDFHKNVAGLSFLSFVYPHNNWALGVYRHQLARNRMDRQIEGPFFDCSGGFRYVNPMPPFCEPPVPPSDVLAMLFRRFAFDPPMSSLPAGTRPRRSGTLNVVEPSPAP